MDTGTVLLTYLAAKLVPIAFGVLIAYWGYQLFVKGVFRAAGSVDAAFKDMKLVVKRGAPGTFLILIGAAVILVTLLTAEVKITSDVTGEPDSVVMKGPPPPVRR